MFTAITSDRLKVSAILRTVSALMLGLNFKWYCAVSSGTCPKSYSAQEVHHQGCFKSVFAERIATTKVGERPADIEHLRPAPVFVKPYSWASAQIPDYSLPFAPYLIGQHDTRSPKSASRIGPAAPVPMLVKKLHQLLGAVIKTEELIAHAPRVEWTIFAFRPSRRRSRYAAM